MSITGLFNIARTALSASQQGLTVTGHNISNVSTPGYSRQDVRLQENPPVDGRPGQLGTGVQVTEIRRSVDQFIERQLTASYMGLGQASVLRQELFRLQGLFGDAEDHGLGAGLNDWFQAVHDVANHPADVTPRSVLLTKAAALASRFNETAASLTAEQQSVNEQVVQLLGEVNTLARRIADLNGKIGQAELTGQNANDLRDQRGVLVNDLAERIDLSVLEQANGELTVFVGRGQMLIDGMEVRRLVPVASADRQGLVDIGYDAGGAQPAIITSMIGGGRLKGLLDIRDGTIPSVLRAVDTLAAALITEVNQLHQVGYGLDGSTALDFFHPLSVTSRASGLNTGTGVPGDAAISANSLLTFQDYEIRFAGPNAYTILNATTGESVRGNYTGTVIAPPSAEAPARVVTGVNDTLAVTVDGVASGTITLTGAAAPGQPYTSGAALAGELQARINGDATLAAAGRSVTVLFDPTTNRLVLTSNSTSASSAVDVTGGTARADLGLMSGLSTAASGTYTSPTTLAFDGIMVTLSGAPAANDVIAVNTRDQAARNMGVALRDPRAVAASTTQAGVPGNNANALALAGLQGVRFTSLGNTTLHDYYRTTATEVGVAAQAADRRLQAEDALHGQLHAFRDQVSGVSIDEELVNMLKFQRAFEAAARLIVTADELMQTLLSLKR